MNLDRFAQGLRDPQSARVLGICASCQGEIYEGALIYVLSNGEFIHARDGCLAGYYDARLASIEEVMGNEF